MVMYCELEKGLSVTRKALGWSLLWPRLEVGTYIHPCYANVGHWSLTLRGGISHNNIFGANEYVWLWFVYCLSTWHALIWSGYIC